MEVNFSPMCLLKIEYHIHVSIPRVEQPHMISHGRGVNKVGPHKGEFQNLSEVKQAKDSEDRKPNFAQSEI